MKLKCSKKGKEERKYMEGKAVNLTASPAEGGEEIR